MLRSSPITKLFGATASSPFRVAPEVADDLLSVIDNRRITLLFVDEPKKVQADFDPSTGIIRLDLLFLEALWAAAHSYIVTFQEYQAAQRKGERYLALGAIPRVANAYSLYRVFVGAATSRTPVPWPSSDIRPIRFPYHYTDGHAANELFLVAVAWILHHEIAHCRLGHPHLKHSVAPVVEENAADASATRWLCANEPKPLPLLKRSMGMVTAVVFLLALELRAGLPFSRTHPPSFERLMRNLESTGYDENETIHAFAFVLVDIHLAEEGIIGEIDREQSLRDMCASACFLLRGASRNGA